MAPGLPAIPSPTIGATTGDRPAASGFTPAPTGFATHSKARPSTPTESSSPRRPARAVCVTDWSFSFRCSPPRLAAAQLLQVLAQNTVPDGRGLSPRRVVTLHSARAATFLSLNAGRTTPPTPSCIEKATFLCTSAGTCIHFRKPRARRHAAPGGSRDKAVVEPSGGHLSLFAAYRTHASSARRA